MGKSARLRSRSSSSSSSSSSSAGSAGSAAAAGPGEMRRNRMKSTPAALAAGRGCREASLILSLLVAFALALFTVFAFTLRPGHHAPLKRVPRTTIRSSSAEAERRDLEGAGLPPQLEPDDSVGVYGYEVVQEFSHDPDAFTQGLAYAGNGTLYESTGLRGRSSVREVDLQTGEVRRKHQMERRYFGEGLTIWKNSLLQVVWQEKKVLIYDRETLAPQGEASHQMQDGWGLTTSNDHVIGSDGTSKLYFMDPDTFKGSTIESAVLQIETLECLCLHFLSGAHFLNDEVRVMTVKDEDKEVGWLNELEFVNDEIWANIWQGGCIARISPLDGKVTGWILLHGLRNELLSTGVQHIDVLNGIAWDNEEDKLYVTGKLWPKLYEIRLLDKTHNANGSLDAVRRLCNIGHQGFQ